MNEYGTFIEMVLAHASRIATDNFGKVAGVVKPGDNNQVLTETDIEIGNYLVEQVTKKYPEYNIIDEEAGAVDRGSLFTWVIDPIDGTSNFANGVPTYGIMIGLLHDDKPIAGGIALPAFGEIYIAAEGLGAVCNSEKINVTNEDNLINSLVAYGIDGHQENPEVTKQETALLGDIILNIRNLRSSNSTYDQILVAKGMYGASMNRTSKIWDNVAQQIVIEEAGGVYTDFYGNPVDYSNPLQKVDTNFTWCAGSPLLHAQLQKIINKN